MFKKSLLFTLPILFLLASNLSAAEQLPRMWRSTQVATAELFNVKISTAFSTSVTSCTILLHKVIVNTAGAGSLRLYRGNNSTATAKLYETIDTNVTGDGKEYNVKFSSGLIYSKTGAANITILWDFVPPFLPLANWGDGYR